VISESATTEFSLSISKSIGYLGADESRRHYTVVSLIIFESLATEFSVMIIESTGTPCTDESRLQLCRQSR
jgi:hypothetical protein